MENCKITEIFCERNELRPAIVNFQNGTVIENMEKQFKCDIFKNRKGNFVPVVATDKMVYLGEVNRDDEVETTFLAVRNKSTNTMKLIAVDVALLKVTFPDSEDKEEKPIRDYVNKASALSKQFGSKQSKRKTEQMDKLRVNIDTIKEHLEETVSNIKIDEADLIPAAKFSELSYLPRCNKNAESVEEVYRLEDLIPTVVFESLDGVATEYLNGNETISLSTEYCKEELKKLKSQGNGDLHNAKILIYIDTLISLLFVSSARIGARDFNPCDYNALVSQYLLNTFTVKSEKKRIRPMSMREKTTCHILVLIAIINNFTLKLDELAVAIKTNIKKLTAVCRLLLFTFDQKTKNIAELKLPLPNVSHLKRSPAKRRKF